MNTIYVVTEGWQSGETSGQWFFFDEASARAKFAAIRAEIVEAPGKDLFGCTADFVVLEGPFAPGEQAAFQNSKKIAYSNPGLEARQGSRNKKRKLAKMASATEPTDGYAAMRMRDGG